MAHVATKGHKDAQYLYCLPPVTIQELEGYVSIGAMAIWVACDATWFHGDIWDNTVTEIYAWFMVLLQPGSVLEISDPFCHQRPHRCPGSGL